MLCVSLSKRPRDSKKTTTEGVEELRERQQVDHLFPIKGGKSALPGNSIGRRTWTRIRVMTWRYSLVRFEQRLMLDINLPRCFYLNRMIFSY